MVIRFSGSHGPPLDSITFSLCRPSKGAFPQLMEAGIQFHIQIQRGTVGGDGKMAQQLKECIDLPEDPSSSTSTRISSTHV